MDVKLQWITPTAEQFILYNARASSPETRDTNTNTGLLGYCIRSRHWSPFEQSNMCIQIQTSRAISAQILRHRSFSFQEFSQRYAEVNSIEPIELRKQAERNRQSSTDVFDPVIAFFYKYDENGSMIPSNYTASRLIKASNDNALETYSKLIESGVAKECARMVLPMASQTILHMNGTIRSWIHYLEIRDEEHAQLEHQLIAREIKKIFIEQLPIISEALGWIGSI